MSISGEKNLYKEEAGIQNSVIELKEKQLQFFAIKMAREIYGLT
jgi:hypothetical protein